MNTMEVANKLVALCREGKNLESIQTLYADDAVSVEAGVPPGVDMSREARGLTELAAKSKWWFDNHEVHSATITGPWPHDERFIVGFQFDVTNKPSGMRMQMNEVGLYTVKGGKIVREEFFYSMGG